MTTLLLAFAAMLILVAAMAVGVMLGRKPIAGSCGGMKALGMNMECEICGGDASRCETGAADLGRVRELAVDASKQR